MLDPANSNSKVMGRWLGRFAADAECRPDAVYFYLRNAAGNRIDAVECRPATTADLKRPLRKELAALRRQLDQIEPRGKAELAIHRLLTDQLKLLTSAAARIEASGQFFRYRDGEGRQRLAWCWGFQRTDLAPTPVVACAGCALVFINRPDRARKCPACQRALPIKRFPWKKFVAATFACVLLAGSAYATWWFVQPRGLVEGQVVWALDNRPLPGASVRIAGTSFAAQTAANGDYRLERLPQGRVTIEVVLAGYEPKTIEVDVVANKPTTAPVALQGDATITGTLLNGAPGGLPIPNAEITIVDSPCKATTNQEGRYELAGVRSGKLEVHAAAPGFSPAVFPAAVEPGTTLDLPLNLTGDARLVGQVRSASKNKPVAAAVVRIVGGGLESRTDAEGWYVFKQAPRGLVVIEVEAEGYLSEPAKKELFSGQEGNLQVLLNGAGRVLGRVINGKTRLPIANAEVSVAGTRLVAKTDDEGRFTLIGVPIGEADIQFMSLGFRTVIEKVKLETEKDSRIKDVELRGASKLTGNVIDGSNDKPVARADVAVRGTTFKTQTDSRGEFKFDEVTSLAIEVEVAAEGFATAVAIDEQVGEGEPHKLKVVLDGDAIVEGIVTDVASDEPVDAAQIMIAETRLKGVSGKDGRYRIKGVRSGSAEIQVRADGFSDQSLKQELDSGKPTSVAIALAGNAVLEGNIVHLLTGKPVAEARVVVAKTKLAVTAGPDGRFRIEKLRGGAAKIEVSAEGHGRQTFDVALVSGKSTTADSLELGGEAVFAGEVVDETTMQPIVGAEVQLAETKLKAKTDAQGMFRLANAFGGPVKVKVSADGFQSQQLDQELAARGETKLSVPVALVGLGEIVGRVVDAEGMAVAGAKVSVARTAHTAKTGVDGRFNMKKCPAGKVELEVDAAGFESAQVPSVLNAKGPTTVAAIELTSATNLGGRVINAVDAKPVAGVTVSIPQAKTTIKTVTDALGQFTLDRVPVRKIPIRMEGQGFITEQVDVDDPTAQTEFEAIVSPDLKPGQARIVLTWEGATPLNLHLFATPTGKAKTRIGHDQPNPANAAGAQIDVARREGQGPQTISIANLVPGKYEIWVEAPLNVAFDRAGAKLRIYRSGQAKAELLQAPEGSEGHRFWYSCSITVDTDGAAKVNPFKKSAFKDALPEK
jgi:hypothetical protein